MHDVEPPKRRRVRHAVKEKRPLPKKAEPVAPPKQISRASAPATAAAPLVPPAVRLDGSTVERLRKGKVEPEATLDLHGLTQAQAHMRLATFVRRSCERQLRCVLVVTGKGAPATSRGGDEGAFELHSRSRSGVLREMVPRWLAEGDLRPLIAGSHGAHIRHGGGGALYVYLKKAKSAGRA
jgi:DNA-nicking Smr family endonuclease